MATPTGNRFNDPDKMYDKDGKRLPREKWPAEEDRLANPRNVDMNTFRGKGKAKMVFGKALSEHAPSPDVDEEKARIAAEIGESADLATAVAELRREERGLDDPTPNAELEAKVEAVLERNPEAEKALADAGSEGRGVNPAAFETKTGSAMTDGDNSNLLVEQVRALGKKAQNGDLPARAELEKIALEEYGRETPRQPITRRLSAYGIKKPSTGG